jgi:hypothetical protein
MPPASQASATPRSLLHQLFLTASLCLLSACHSIGPDTVTRDRSDYSVAMTDSWKQETLLNIVKLRYLDPPIFVDVGQIIAGYSVEAGGSAQGTIYPSAQTGNNTNFGINGSYSDHPTITYVPLTGENFLQSVVTPLTPESLFFCVQSGLPADVMLRLGVGAINGLKNEQNSTTGHIEANPKFLRVTDLMRQLQMSGVISIRVHKGKDKDQQSTIFTLRSRDVAPDIAADIHELDELLGLDPKADEYDLVYGSMAANSHEIAVLTRSLLSVMTSMAMKVQVPPSDVTEGRAMPGATSDPKAQTQIGFVIHCSIAEPSDAFVAVSYRRHWFWIDDRDLASKRDFAFIMLLFTLSDTSLPSAPPLITIPTQ